MKTGGLVRLTPGDWALLEHADGTRDLEGIRLSAARAGHPARAAEVRALLEDLDEIGLIEDGEKGLLSSEAAALEAPPEAPSAEALDRPLDVLPEFRLHCDGGGACCRIYASVLFSTLEAARARVLMPEVLGGGMRPSRVFMPERGPVLDSGAAVAFVEGRCAYLLEDGRCGLHARGGAGGKPLGCQMYPATFVDDGERVRVSIAVECGCVIESIGRAPTIEGGEPLAPLDARARRDLDARLYIAELPNSIELSSRGAEAPRAELIGWSRVVAEGALTAGDVPAALWRIAQAVEAHGLSEAGARDALSGSSCLTPSALRPWFEALAARAGRASEEDAYFRGDRDLVRRIKSWIASASTALLNEHTCGELLARGAPRPDEEVFYLRAIAHGHQLVSDIPLAESLRDRAVRLLVARSLPSVMTTDEPDGALAHPLALVEAVIRGHGLAGYAAEVAVLPGTPDELS
jgi:lysine-N-methylase